MVRNEEKFAQALQFRRRGFTLDEIAKICDVSKSTVSKWLKNNAISADITKQNKRRAGVENAKRLRLVSKARGSERLNRYKEAERSAATEYKHYKKDALFVAGVLAYACDGDRNDKSRIRLSSSKSDVHGTFVRFLKAYMGLESSDISIWLQLYPSHNEERCMRSWRKQSTLPFSQFGKSQIMKTNKKTKPLHDGVGNTIIGNTVLKRKLDVWVKLTLQELNKK